MMQKGDMLNAPNNPQSMATATRKRTRRIKGDASGRQLTQSRADSDHADEPSKPECRAFGLWLLTVDVNRRLKCVHRSAGIVGSLSCLVGSKIVTHCSYANEST